MVANTGNECAPVSAVLFDKVLQNGVWKVVTEAEGDRNAFVSLLPSYATNVYYGCISTLLKEVSLSCTYSLIGDKHILCIHSGRSDQSFPKKKVSIYSGNNMCDSSTLGFLKGGYVDV